MPMYDYQCPACKTVEIDVLAPVESTRLCSAPTGYYSAVVGGPVDTFKYWTGVCGTKMERVWLAKAPCVVGDECDVTVRHGICNADGSPRRYTSKAEMRQEAVKKGLVNTVRHQGKMGSDKSDHTVKWT